MENRHYYDQMTRDEKSAYEAMLSGFEELSPSIRVPLLGGKALGDVFFRLRLDNPMIFYVSGCSFRFAAGASYAQLLPEYMFDRQRIPEQKRAVEARVEKLLRPAQSLDEAGRERFVHDFICGNVRYDKLKKPYSHEIIGPLQNGVGVCEGIAKTVKLLCERLDIPCLIAVSEANPDVPNGYLHAWNVVRVGGKDYHLDATFDNTLARCGVARYDYYNLDDAHIFRDHRPLLYPVPACRDGDAFYYRKAGLSWTKPEDVEKRTAQALRKKKDSLLFHWRGGYLTREVLQELLTAAETAAGKQGKGIACGVNWGQSVILLRFTDAPVRGEIRTEQIDEEEEI